MNKLVRPEDLAKPQTAKSVDELLRGFKSGISYRTLEPRIAFDGAAVATAVAVAGHQEPVGGDTASATGEPADVTDVHHSSADHGGGSTAPSPVDASNDLAGAIATLSAAPATAAGPSIVFIDSAVENISQIVSSIDPGAEIILINAQSSGLEQIAGYLSGRTNVGSIHIVSHGEAGTLYLGSDALTTASLSGNSAELAVIGRAMSDSGDILLYGCEIGKGNAAAWMPCSKPCQSATGADVAASIDYTGGR